MSNIIDYLMGTCLKRDKDPPQRDQDIVDNRPKHIKPQVQPSLDKEQQGVQIQEQNEEKQEQKQEKQKEQNSTEKSSIAQPQAEQINRRRDLEQQDEECKINITDASLVEILEQMRHGGSKALIQRCQYNDIYLVRKQMTQEGYDKFKILADLEVGVPVYGYIDGFGYMAEGTPLHHLEFDQIPHDYIRQFTQLHNRMKRSRVAHCDVKLPNMLLLEEEQRIVLCDNENLTYFGQKRRVCTWFQNLSSDDQEKDQKGQELVCDETTDAYGFKIAKNYLDLDASFLNKLKNLVRKDDVKMVIEELEEEDNEDLECMPFRSNLHNEVVEQEPEQAKIYQKYIEVILKVGIDLIFITDFTFSMEPWIEQTKKAIHQIHKFCERSYQHSLLRVGLVGFRDFGDSQQFIIKELSTDYQELLTMVENEKATGGTDLPEDTIGALRKCLNFDLSQKNLTFIVLLTDAPCHGPFKNPDSKYHDNHPNKYTRDDLKNVLQTIESKCGVLKFSAFKISEETDLMFTLMKDYMRQFRVFDKQKYLKIFGKSDRREDDFLKSSVVDFLKGTIGVTISTMTNHQIRDSFSQSFMAFSSNSSDKKGSNYVAHVKLKRK